MARKVPKALQAMYGAGNAARVEAGKDATERDQTVLTPPEIVRELARTAGTLLLDPCTTEANPLGALVWCAGPGLHGGCGLRMPWPAHSGAFTWVNYPFGDMGPWMEKCVREGAAGAPIWAIGPLRTHRRYGDLGTIRALQSASHAWTCWPVAFLDEFGKELDGFPFPLFLAGWNVPEPDQVMYKGRELRSGRLRLESL